MKEWANQNLNQILIHSIQEMCAKVLQQQQAFIFLHMTFYKLTFQDVVRLHYLDLF